MLGAHALSSEIETVTGIHCGLTRKTRSMFAKNAGALDLIVTFLIGKIELCPFRAAVHLHLFVLAELRFAPNAAISTTLRFRTKRSPCLSGFGSQRPRRNQQPRRKDASAMIRLLKHWADAWRRGTAWQRRLART